MAKLNKKQAKKKYRAAPNPTGKNGDRTNAILASQGNKWWKVRAKHGVDAIFTEPKKMWESFEEYEEFCINNPDYSVEYKGTPLRPVAIPLKRAMFIEGFCAFIDSNKDWWNQFKRSKTYEENKDFSRVMKNIEMHIYNDQQVGGSNGKLNPMFMARVMMLRENMSVDVGDQRKDAADLFPDDSEFSQSKKKNK